MPKSIRFPRLPLAALVTFFSLGPAIAAPQQLAPTPRFEPVQSLAFDTSGPVLRAHTQALKPFTVAGERGVILGQQDGTFEAWLLPIKVLSHLTIQADVEGYSVPIDVNQQSAEIEVRPDRTTITYSHIAFTVRQIMFSPEDGPAGTGPVVLFQFDCLRPTDFTFRFTPSLEFMWPMRNEGHPSPEWIPGVSDGKALPGGVNGFYLLHADYPDLAAALTIPGARSGILAPYQERPQIHPAELKLHIDPARDNGRLYPLLMAIGTNPAAANSRALGATLEKLNQSIPDLYRSHSESYKKLLADSVSIDTPDKSLNEAFQWAVVSIEQLKAKPWSPEKARNPSANNDASGDVKGHDFSRANQTQNEARALVPAGRSSQADPADETALVAGYYASGDSARPGFGWFFGRDALYTLYAVNGYGDFALSKSELEFLIHRQRADGKIMHEYSQTAPAIDWQQFPYMYAAADSTPLFLLATLDYVRASGDTAFLTANRDAIEKAWAFETSHADTNGIYDNRQGTGWVESWPGGMPHQEIYLALLDQQASAAMGQIEDKLHDLSKAKAANRRAEDIAAAINSQFYDKEKGCYAFSRNSDGSLDRTTTVYPALAWWSQLPGTASASGSILTRGDQCLQQLASHTLNTDWGLRDVSNDEKIYDGMSYHQGSVWPLFTGWAALAEYRGGQPLAGYQMLMENANLTEAQDLGAVTELLSGDFNVPFGRSTSHQLWSSAMVITPTLRGLFGIDIDATTKTITVNPHLPAGWESATIRNLRVGQSAVDLAFNQVGGAVSVRMSGSPDVRLAGPGGRNPGAAAITIPRPQVAVALPWQQPLPGDRTHSVRITREEYSDRRLVVELEAPAGTRVSVPVVAPSGTRLTVEGARLGAVSAAQDQAAPLALSVDFPRGEGWKAVTVTLGW